ncbi:hypothetical protein Moror_852 [Moniliophthora roreri MCA 2997]|uniref:Uncharacterized protein n=2 Tax=Moniliophthora roreri TaxID=221103 RepID=V2X7Z1_MONRO|nr:hypothetical protein Moror_852 [Moniliophthora roreri MCA 2997]
MSSPSVRSSPYPSLSSANTSANRTQGNGYRRSSGSEVATRRVLADIEWWRVTDGQCDLDAEQELEDNNRNQDQVDPVTVQQGEGPGNTAQTSPTMLQFSSLSSDVYPLSPTDEYPVLAIPPQTPPRRHLRDSSASSLESTPELVEGPVESLRLGMEYLDLGLTPSDAFPAPPSSIRNGRATENDSSPSVRPRSLLDSINILQNSTIEDYADFSVSPLSSSTPHMFN